MIDPAIVGRELEPVSFPIDRSKLAELARSFHDDDPVWHAPAAAERAGFDGVPTPPTVTVLADHWRAAGALEPALALGADLKRLLHGEASWELLRPIRLGDVLTATTTVTDVSTREGRRGGAMTLATLTTVFTDASEEIVVRRHDTLIERGEKG